MGLLLTPEVHEIEEDPFGGKQFKIYYDYRKVNSTEWAFHFSPISIFDKQCNLHPSTDWLFREYKSFYVERNVLHYLHMFYCIGIGMNLIDTEI